MQKIIAMLLIMALLASCATKKNSHNYIATDTATNNILFPTPKVKISNIGILLYNGYTTLDAMGPYQVLSELMGVNVFFVGRHKGIILNGRGMKVQVDTSIAEVKQLDVLVIPGGLKDTYAATKDMELLNWVKAIDSTTTYTASVCTGAWILGAAGLLQNKNATTHWYGKKILATQFGATIVNKRFANSGKYWTSAGVSAGMDMCLALVNEINGEAYTRAAMLDMEYDPQPPFNGGSENNTDKAVVESVRKMYDGAMDEVLHPERAFKKIQFANTRDFICNMPTSAGVADTAHYKGKVYGFCATACKDEFKQQPQAYVKAK
jgi:putative intracellular protease/amidase/YHS domain-containing protein